MYVYKITNKINNKIYIGITVRTIEERFQEHYYKRNERKHLHLYSSIIKYGFDNFKIEKIDEANSIKELFDKEIYWIDKLNSKNHKIGYNNTNGGEGFQPIDIDEDLMLELYIKTRSSAMVAKELECSDNTILRRLRKYTNTDRGMSILTPEVIKLYQVPYTIQDICQILNICNKTVMKILNDNDIERHTFYKSVPNMEKILEYYKNNNISFTELSKIYNIPRKRLSRLIKYKLKI